jgi:hypothetical protein
MQCESFLEHQGQMQSRKGKDNAQSIFGLEQIPTMRQMRNVLDKTPAQELFKVFNETYQALQREGYLKAFNYISPRS